MSSFREHIEAFSELSSYCADRLWLLWDTDRKRLLLCMLASLPAIVVVCTTVVAAILLVGPGGRMTNWYLQRAAIAMNEQKYGVARLCYSGLLQQEPDNQQYQFGLALSLFGLGDNSAALILTRRLAPDSSDGYPPAHVFVAEQLLAENDPTADQLRMAEWHLLRAQQADPTNRRSNALLAAIYARTNRWEDLKKHLPLAGGGVDEIGLLVAQSYAARGDAPEAEVWAKRAATFFRNRCLADPTDRMSRMKWAEASLMLREFDTALESLDSGWRDFHDPAFKKAAAQVCLAWSNMAALTPARRILTLARGLDYDSTNPRLLLQLTQPVLIDAAVTSKAATQPSEGAVAQAIIRAIAACIAQDQSEVTRQVSTAVSLGTPETIIMIANTATLWGFSDHPNAMSALRLSSALVELCPQSPFAQRAQGLVLSRQKRWNRASSHLELFLKLVPDDVAVRTQLAACYDEMGMPEEASAHRAILRATTQPATSPATGQGSTQPAHH